MSLVGFKARNHPQQVGRKGANAKADDRETPPGYFLGLNALYRFTLDAAASKHNAKCALFYTREDDGLKRSWAGERVWCNPPYSDIRSWVEKAWAEWNDPGRPRVQLIVMLLPANRTEQAWWQDLVEYHRDRRGSPLRVRFLRGRMRFIIHGDSVGPNERPPFGCCLLIWDSRGKGHVELGSVA